MERRFKAGGTVLVAALVATLIGPVQHATAAPTARADFDGDGKGDLAIGVPGEDVGGSDRAGAVNVLYGSRRGLTAAGDHFFHQNNLEDEAEADDEFGFATTAGDFDGDGYADLAIGAPGESSMLTAGHGAVHVIYGSSDGLSTAAGEDLFTEDDLGVDAAESENRFGAALVAGNFDDDGYVDLAIGHPGEDVGAVNGAGAVTVVYGSADGLNAADTQLWHQDSSGIEDEAETGEISDPTEAFGTALARRDFDGDGIADLAVGVPGEFVGDAGAAGAVNVIFGTDDGLAATGDQLLHQDIDGVRDQAENSGDGSGDAFGSALAAGDFDDDGFGDLAIGVPNEGVGGVYGRHGAVAVLYGSSAGLSGAGDLLLHENIEGIPSTAGDDDRFGAALAAGDFDGNGKDDLAIGVPDENVKGVGEAGAVHVLYGRAAGITVAGNDFWHQAKPDVRGRIQHSDHFGSSLVARNFGRGARADLAIGVPDEDAGSSADEVLDAGRVQVFYSKGGGLTATDSQQWQQDTRGIADDGETEDQFGYSMG